MVNFARCKCLGANVLRGPDQIPWDGKLKYDYQLWIDSDIVFDSNKFWQLCDLSVPAESVKEDGSIDHAATDRKFAVLGENKYARASVAGIANIPNELYKIGRYIGGDRTPDNLYALQDLGLELEDDKDDFAYQTTKFLAGFLLPYAGLSKTGKVLSGWKMLKGVNGLGLANPAFRSFVAGSIAETIAIDAYDENFFNSCLHEITIFSKLMYNFIY